jgi:hypothetical protein
MRIIAYAILSLSLFTTVQIVSISLGQKSTLMPSSNTTTLSTSNMTSLLVSPLFLPTGQWHISVNGSTGSLNIVSVNPNNGEVFGTMNLAGQPMHQIKGLYDDISGKITFMRVINPATLQIQIFTGYLNGTPFALAGYFVTLDPSGANAERNTFGWHAEI